MPFESSIQTLRIARNRWALAASWVGLALAASAGCCGQTAGPLAASGLGPPFPTTNPQAGLPLTTAPATGSGTPFQWTNLQLIPPQPAVGSSAGVAAIGSSNKTGLPLIDGMLPSNHRDWVPNLAVLSFAEFHGDQVTVRNIRNTRYRTEDDYTIAHYDKTYDLRRLRNVDFLVVPFAENNALAHTFISFGFEGGEQLAVSVEIRPERGESYDPLKGMFRQYELMYVVADERDLIRLRVEQRKVDIYLYRSRATPEQAQALFVDVMQRVNKLAVEPEFYHTVTNNCTTNIVQHVNRLSPNSVPFDYRVFLPGYSDRMAYDLGLLDTTLSFEETKQRARINVLAYQHRNAPDFSRKIRGL